jgi:hypothetical protein
MASQPYAVVNTASTIVQNIVQWDGVSSFPPPSGCTLVSAVSQPNAQIGGTYVGGVFTAPAAPAAQQGQVFINSPTSGATVPIPNPPPAPGTQTLYVILEPAAALTSLVLALPPLQPNDGTVLTLFSTRNISNLTFSGGTVNNAPTSLTALTQYNIIWSSQYNVYFQL